MAGPKLREFCREVVSTSRNEIHQTWGPPYSGALYVLENISRTDSWPTQIFDVIRRLLDHQFLTVKVSSLFSLHWSTRHEIVLVGEIFPPSFLTFNPSWRFHPKNENSIKQRPKKCRNVVCRVTLAKGLASHLRSQEEEDDEKDGLWQFGVRHGLQLANYRTCLQTLQVLLKCQNSLHTYLLSKLRGPLDRGRGQQF